MKETPEFGAYHTRPPLLWLIVILAGLLTLIFGVCGFVLYNESIHATRSQVLFNSLYETAQLFVLHTPEYIKPPDWRLEVARFAGATFFFFSLSLGLWQIAVMEGRHLRFGWKAGHVVICGAGWRGITLARDYLERGTPEIIVLEADPECRGVAECERLGIPFFIGDASDPALLASVAVAKAHRVVAVCGSDETNLEIAIRASGIKRRAHQPLKCSIHLSNDDLRAMVRQRGFAQPEDSLMEISTFGTDIFENAARRLFRQTPLDRVPLDQNSPLRIHLIIIGFGEMGQAVLMQAACIAHYANVKKLRVTIADPRATVTFAEFAGRRPGISEIAEVKTLDRALHDATLVTMFVDAAREPEFLTTCVIASLDEKLNLTVAVKFGDSLADHSVPVRWWLHSRSDAGLGLIFSDKLQNELGRDNVVPFGSLEDVCTVEMLEQEEPEEMGRIIHENYVVEQAAKGETLKDNPSLKPWKQMPETFKYSNRLAADHIVIKMRALGYSLHREPQSDCVSEFTEDQIEILSRMEHARYCAERWMDGWQYGKRKDLVAKTNPTLLPWDYPLPEIERVKDRDQVRKIPSILRKAGWYICR